MEFKTNNFGFHLQIIPIYGLSLGILYYNPNLEPISTKVNDDDFYEQLTAMFLIFGLHLTWWRL
jgi:hypothetical protein